MKCSDESGIIETHTCEFEKQKDQNLILNKTRGNQKIITRSLKVSDLKIFAEILQKNGNMRNSI